MRLLLFRATLLCTSAVQAYDKPNPEMLNTSTAEVRAKLQKVLESFVKPEKATLTK